MYQCRTPYGEGVLFGNIPLGGIYYQVYLTLLQIIHYVGTTLKDLAYLLHRYALHGYETGSTPCGHQPEAHLMEGLSQQGGPRFIPISYAYEYRSDSGSEPSAPIWLLA